MKHKNRDLLRVKHILDSIQLVKKFTDGLKEEVFLEDELIQSAVARQFEIIGEATSHITQDTQKKFPNIEWRVIKDFRNLLIHEYFRVDASELWYSVINDIDKLEEQITIVLKFLEK